MRTEDLISQLAREARPVQPLPAPALRSGMWLISALAFALLVASVIGLRPDLTERLLSTRYLLEQGAALLTGLAAAFAAFVASTPGYDRRLIWLVAAPGGLWLGTLGLGCVGDWIRYGADGLRLTPDPECLLYIALIGSLPVAIIVAMLRRGAPLAPRLTLTLAGLAAAAIGNFGLRLFHTQDAALMVLVWQVGAVLVLAALSGLLGGSLLRWPHRPS